MSTPSCFTTLLRSLGECCLGRLFVATPYPLTNERDRMPLKHSPYTSRRDLAALHPIFKALQLTSDVYLGPVIIIFFFLGPTRLRSASPLLPQRVSVVEVEARCARPRETHCVRSNPQRRPETCKQNKGVDRATAYRRLYRSSAPISLKAACTPCKASMMTVLALDVMRSVCTINHGRIRGVRPIGVDVWALC